MASSNAGCLHARWPRAGSTSVSRTTAETVILKQPFGKRSRQSLSDLCAAKRARVVWSDKDRNRRLLVRVWCSGIDANAERCAGGWPGFLTATSRIGRYIPSKTPPARRGLVYGLTQRRYRLGSGEKLKAHRSTGRDNNRARASGVLRPRSRRYHSGVGFIPAWRG